MRAHFTLSLSLLTAFVLFPILAFGQTTVLTNGDTKIIQTQPNTNFGSRGWLHVNNQTNALFSFDVSGISGPVAAQLQVQIVAGGVRSAGPVAVYGLAEPWSENIVTWSTQPMLGDQVSSEEIPPSAGDEVVSFDVSALVNRWLDDPSSNYGLSLQQDAGGTEVVFRSRESQGGAFPARLVITSAGPSSNTVTVAVDGGDYDNPADAADNADTGDRWCDRSSMARCRILVEAGSYSIDRTIVLPQIDLAGAGRSTTMLVADEGLEAVIESDEADRSTVADLAVINRQSAADMDATGMIGALNVYRVDIAVESTGSDAIGLASTLLSSDDFTTMSLSDVRVDVKGYRATGIDAPLSSTYMAQRLDIEGSEIRVEATGRARGVYVDELDPSSGTAYITNSVIEADGGERAYALDLPNARVWSSRLSATGNLSNAEGVRATGKWGPSVSIENSEVTGGSVGVNLQGQFGCRGSIRGSSVRSSFRGGSAMVIRHSIAESCNITVVSSQLSALSDDGTALNLTLSNDISGTNVRIDHSKLAADTALKGTTNFSVQIGASKLSGLVVPGGADLTCVYVYNGNYAPLDSACQ